MLTTHFHLIQIKVEVMVWVRITYHVYVYDKWKMFVVF